jgi:hypothetical protein
VTRLEIDVLPDDALVEIFHFYVDTMSRLDRGKTGTEAWQLLVHVCQRWRSVVFQSPSYLNLRLYCTPKTPVRDKLDIWPSLPLIVEGNMASTPGTGNIIAALGRSDRVCRVSLFHLADWQLEEVSASMQMLFPQLTDLLLSSNGDSLPVIPDSFLEGTAPRLRYFSLSGIPFPGLPKLLLSADNLFHLELSNNPHSGYISPEAIVALLSALSSLSILSLEFQSPQSRPDLGRRRLPPLTGSVVPALTSFHFKGVIDYLEELVACIYTPRLDELHITFFNRIDFDCPRLAQFINRTPTLREYGAAHVQFDDSYIGVRLGSRNPTSSSSGDLSINISCGEPDWQLSSIEQICNSSLPPLSTVEDLYIECRYSELVWEDNSIDNSLWLRLLLPFTAVKDVYLSEEFAPGIAVALQELFGFRITEVLPGVRNIFVEGLETAKPFRENIAQFVTEREHFAYPVVVSDWDKDPKIKSMDEDSDSKLKLMGEDSDSKMKSIDEDSDAMMKLVDEAKLNEAKLMMMKLMDENFDSKMKSMDEESDSKIKSESMDDDLDSNLKWMKKLTDEILESTMKSMDEESDSKIKSESMDEDSTMKLMGKASDSKLKSIDEDSDSKMKSI